MPLRAVVNALVGAALLHAAAVAPLHAQAPVRVAPAGKGPSLRLSEAWSLAIPDTIMLAGLSIGSQGRIVAWDALHGQVFLVTPFAMRAVPVATLTRPVGAAITGTEGALRLEILDARGPTLRVVSLEGVPLHAYQLPLEAVDAAEYSNGRWYLLARTTRDDRRLARYLPGGSITWLRTPRDIVAPDGALDVHLSPTIEGVAITRMRTPYLTALVGESAAIRRLDASRAIDSIVAATAQRWLALASIDLGPALLQSVADMTSDQRLFVLTSRATGIATVRRVTAALGFAAADRDRQLLLAVRRIARSSPVRRGRPCTPARPLASTGHARESAAATCVPA